jgi:uric acid transporter
VRHSDIDPDVGFGPFGIRLPIILGVTAVSISPMLSMAAMPGVGLTGIYRAVLVGGIFGLCVAPFVKYVLRFFPAVVTGMIGVVLMRVGVNWPGGGARKVDFGAAGYLVVAGFVLAVILLVINLPAASFRTSPS